MDNVISNFSNNALMDDFLGFDGIPSSARYFQNNAATPTMTTDDFADDTSTTGVLEVGGTAATGIFDFEFDSDWFAIDLTAGETTIISLDNFDADFVLRDASGSVVALGELGFGAIEQTLIADVAQSGTYYIDVTNILPGSGVDYTLSASLDDFADDTSTTGVLETGGFANGTIDFNGDSDWFAIELTAGELTHITSSLVGGDFILRDSSGAFLAGPGDRS